MTDYRALIDAIVTLVNDKSTWFGIIPRDITIYCILPRIRHYTGNALSLYYNSIRIIPSSDRPCFSSHSHITRFNKYGNLEIYQTQSNQTYLTTYNLDQTLYNIETPTSDQANIIGFTPDDEPIRFNADIARDLFPIRYTYVDYYGNILIIKTDKIYRYSAAWELLSITPIDPERNITQALVNHRGELVVVSSTPPQLIIIDIDGHLIHSSLYTTTIAKLKQDGFGNLVTLHQIGRPLCFFNHRGQCVSYELSGMDRTTFVNQHVDFTIHADGRIFIFNSDHSLTVHEQNPDVIKLNIRIIGQHAAHIVPINTNNTVRELSQKIFTQCAMQCATLAYKRQLLDFNKPLKYYNLQTGSIIDIMLMR